MFFLLDIQEIDQQLRNTVSKSYPVSTQRNLLTQINRYLDFCLIYKLSPFPAGELHIRRYAQYLSMQVKSVDTVCNYLSTVRTLHKMLGLPQPPLIKDSFWLNRTIMGLKAVMARPIKQSAPVTPQLLIQMSQHVDIKDHQQLVAWVAMLFGFHLFLRKSNLVPDTEKTFDPSKQLTRASICISECALMVDIIWSKTIQYKQKKLTVPIIPLSNNSICAYFWTMVMVQTIPAGPADPAFSYRKKKKGKLIPLTYDKLSHWLKQWIAESGKDSSLYSSHGLRRGGSTFAYESNIPAQTIQILGDWASQAFLRYIDLSLDTRIDSMVKLADAIQQLNDKK